MGQNHRLVVYEWRMHSPVWLCACLCVKQRYGLLSPVRARVYMTLWKHSCVCVYAGVCERVNEWVKEKEHTMLVWAGVSPHGLIRHSRQLKNPAYVCVNDWLSSQHHQHTRTSALYHRYTLLVGQARSELSTCVPACVYACWEAKLKGFSREITHIWAQILSKAASCFVVCGCSAYDYLILWNGSIRNETFCTLKANEEYVCVFVACHEIFFLLSFVLYVVVFSWVGAHQ